MVKTPKKGIAKPEDGADLPKASPSARLYKQLAVTRQTLKSGASALAADTRVPKSLATATGIDPAHLSRILAGAEPLSPKHAIRISDVLGFDPAYIAAVYFRDLAHCNGQEPMESRFVDASAARGAVSRQPELMSRTAEALSMFAKYANAFRSNGNRTGLALVHVRLNVLKCKPPEPRFTQFVGLLASELKCSREEAAAELRRFEAGAPADGIRWKAFVSAFEKAAEKLLKRSLSEADLKSVAGRLRRLHDVAETWEEQSLQNQRLFTRYCPADERHDLKLFTSRTIYGAITIDSIFARLPRAIQGISPVRIQNACHSGYEISILVSGRVRLTMSEQPLTENELKVKDDGSDVYEAPEVLCFPSGYFHHVEFLGKQNHVISINLRRNVILARPGRDVPSAADALREVARKRRHSRKKASS